MGLFLGIPSARDLFTIIVSHSDGTVLNDNYGTI